MAWAKKGLDVGYRHLPLAPTPEGAVEVQDCESTLEDPTTDVEALNNGFIAEGPVPLD